MNQSIMNKEVRGKSLQSNKLVHKTTVFKSPLSGMIQHSMFALHLLACLPHRHGQNSKYWKDCNVISATRRRQFLAVPLFNVIKIEKPFA